jgi:nucleotide-binding universal stress UspA family protein
VAESLDGWVDHAGRPWARALLLRVRHRAREREVGLPGPFATDCVNTIAPGVEPEFPGDESIERRPRAYCRWNGAVMVHRAQRPDIGVAHVVPWPAAVDPMGVATAACYHGRLAAAEEVLEEAVSPAVLIAPESPVTPHLVTGSAGGVLLERSLGADLLVLGRRSGPRRHLLSPSLDAKVVAHARCPVAVIGPFLILPAVPRQPGWWWASTGPRGRTLPSATRTALRRSEASD